jgi:thiamine-phosphate pyrophosphorylase
MPRRDARASVDKLREAAARMRAHAGAPVAPNGTPLPAMVLVTDTVRLPHPLPAARRLAPGSAVLLRHYDHSGRAVLAGRLAAICEARGLALWIASDVALARDVGAAGLHWREREMASRPRGWRGVVTVSAHSAEALRRAHEIGADAALLGPVFATASHPQATPLGVAALTEIVRGARLPVYALGGIDAANAKHLVTSGACGIAAVGAFLR